MNEDFYNTMLLEKDYIIAQFNEAKSVFVSYVTKTAPNFKINVSNSEFAALDMANSFSLLYTIISYTLPASREKLTPYDFMLTITEFMFKDVYEFSESLTRQILKPQNKLKVQEVLDENSNVTGFTFSFKGVDISGNFDNKTNFANIKEKDFNKLVAKLNPEFSFYDTSENSGYIILQKDRNIFEENLVDTVFDTKNLSQHIFNEKDEDKNGRTDTTTTNSTDTSST